LPCHFPYFATSPSPNAPLSFVGGVLGRLVVGWQRAPPALRASLAGGGGAARVVFGAGSDPHVAGGGTDTAKALALVEEVLAANKEYAARNGAAAAELFGKGQHPRCTLLACSDSRVQAEQFTARHVPANPHDGGVGDIFTVRVIGNLLGTAAGSVEYGVRHLHTPVLLVVGHTSCGAVKAVLSGAATLDGLEPAIMGELSRMDLGDYKGVAAVVANVHAQVDAAVAMFADLVGSKLAVIGGVYDLNDSLDNGAGVLNIVNINGAKSKAAVEDIMRKKAYFRKVAGAKNEQHA
jgi:carbonic anhydrase